MTGPTMSAAPSANVRRLAREALRGLLALAGLALWGLLAALVVG